MDDLKKRLLLNSGKPAFPNSEWPTEADVPVGAVVNDNGELKQSNQVFLNDGLDFIDCGRPANIVDKLDPSLAFRIKIVAKTYSDGFYGPMVMLGGNLSSTRQIQLTHRSDGKIQFGVGGIVGVSLEQVSFDEVHTYELISLGTTFFARIDGVALSLTGNNGSYISALNLVLMVDGVHFNDYWDGEMYHISVYDANDDLIDQYDLTNPSLWDGGAVGESVNGEVFTVTDGVPTTAKSKALIPVRELPYTSRAGFYSRSVGAFNGNEQVGLRDKVTIVNSTFDPNEDFELEIDCTAYDDSYAFSGLFCQGGDSQTRSLWIERTNVDDNLAVFLHIVGGGTQTVANIPYFTNERSILKITKLGNNVDIYIDNVIYYSRVLPNIPYVTSSEISIGAQTSNRTSHSDMYRVELKQGESSFRLEFDEGSGSTVFDKTGNGFDGTITDSTEPFWQRRMLPVGE